MKAPTIWFALALATGCNLAAAEVRQGASIEEVRATLGIPRGQLYLGGRQVLYFERGEVEMQQGRLTRVALRSPEEQAILTAREKRQRGERETRRVQMRAEGTTQRDRKLADPTFQAAPVAYQVAFWEDFARRYPEVSCVEPLTIARMRLNEQIEDNRRRDEQASRLAELEERLAAAERRTFFYPVRAYTSGYGRHHYRSVGLGPITYTFFDSPLPPYTTPSGNPAGNLTGPIINLPASNPALHNSSDQGWPRWERVDRVDHSGRSHGRGSRGSRDRM